MLKKTCKLRTMHHNKIVNQVIDNSVELLWLTHLTGVIKEPDRKVNCATCIWLVLVIVRKN